MNDYQDFLEKKWIDELRSQKFRENQSESIKNSSHFIAENLEKNAIHTINFYIHPANILV